MTLEERINMIQAVQEHMQSIENKEIGPRGHGTTGAILEDMQTDIRDISKGISDLCYLLNDVLSSPK